ncbi:6-bladed beta-propeller [Algoriphagus sp. CAU 1675]|uniref:6-bladed beta-propeller n=1 Tax=Algoriphagus sp. CAU 1675 TaxID=3032597 RepID=UPI0023DA0710|nr:6-bladed beta-propeller [Algoriphagus sp. CAU 1675]MDF2158653.1 6-bladed beta-propeller [Algoriphagus sp. CAU 1675]
MTVLKRVLVIFSVVAFSCGSPETSSKVPKIISLEDVPVQETKLLIDKAVLLGSDSLEFLGSELRTVSSRHGFFVSNYGGAKAIHHFSLDGEHLGRIVEIGDAPGQIPRFDEFRVKEDSLILMTGIGEKEMLSFFSVTDHQMVKQIYVEASGFSFYPNTDGTFWLYSGFNRAVGDYRLRLASPEGKVVSNWMINDFNEELIPFQEQSIFEGDGRLLVRDPLFPIVNMIGKDSLELAYQFDFGTFTIPDETWEIEDPMQWFQRINQNGFGDLVNLFESKEYLVADVVFQREGERQRKIYVLNREIGSERIYPVDEEMEPQYYSPFGLENNHLLFIAYAPALLEVIDQLETSPEIKSQLRSLKEESNPVILYGRLEK